MHHRNAPHCTSWCMVALDKRNNIAHRAIHQLGECPFWLFPCRRNPIGILARKQVDVRIADAQPMVRRPLCGLFLRSFRICWRGTKALPRYFLEDRWAFWFPAESEKHHPYWLAKLGYSEGRYCQRYQVEWWRRHSSHFHQPAEGCQARFFPLGPYLLIRQRAIWWSQSLSDWIFLNEQLQHSSRWAFWFTTSTHCFNNTSFPGYEAAFSRCSRSSPTAPTWLCINITDWYGLISESNRIVIVLCSLSDAISTSVAILVFLDHVPLT